MTVMTSLIKTEVYLLFNLEDVRGLMKRDNGVIKSVGNNFEVLVQDT